MKDGETCEALKNLNKRVIVLETAGVHERVLALEEAHAHVKVELERNTKTTNEIKTDTAVLVEFAQAYRATTIVGRALGQFMVWLAIVAGGIAGLWAAWKTGVK